MSEVPHSKFPNKRLLSLDELTSICPPYKTSKPFFEEIETDLIIGSENRAEDFGEDFLLRRHYLDDRWIRVREAVSCGGIPEAIRLLQYGGYYFVRDGNHRVSVAKAESMSPLYAEITKLSTEVSLPEKMNRKKIPLFKAKVEFHKRTKFFRFVEENTFEVKKPETWKRLEFIIFEIHKKWMAQRLDKEPKNKDLILDWLFTVYEPIAADISQNGWKELFSGRGVTDIFCELAAFLEEEESLTPMLEPEYSAFLLSEQKKHPWTFRKFRKLAKKGELETPEEAGFSWIVNLKEEIPSAEIPDGPVGWRHFLTKNLLYYYRYVYREKFGRPKVMTELSVHWYKEWFLPALKKHKKENIPVPFPEFYQKWMKIWTYRCERGKKYGFKKTFKEAQKSFEGL